LAEGVGNKFDSRFLLKHIRMYFMHERSRINNLTDIKYSMVINSGGANFFK